MKQIITTKKGTTFERNGKDKIYDVKMWFRYTKEKSEKIDVIAKQKGLKTSTFLRQIIDEYLEKQGK